MGRSHETSGKKEVRKKNMIKRKQKEQKRTLKKNEGKRSFDDMIAYVDELGNISSSPPDPHKKSVIDAESIELTVTKNTPPAITDTVRKGKVTFFGKSRGFGFLRDNETGEEVFVHISNLIDAVKESDLVEYELGRGPAGSTALKVKLAAK